MYGRGYKETAGVLDRTCLARKRPWHQRQSCSQSTVRQIRMCSVRYRAGSEIKLKSTRRVCSYSHKRYL